MKWCVVALLLVLGSIQAGMVKQQPQPSITAELQAYDASGEVDLRVVVNGKVGQSIGFKIGDQIEVGVIEHHVINSTKLRVGGPFLNHKNSGFLFEFESLPNDTTRLGGVLIFNDIRKYYTLEFDADKRIVYFQERDVEEKSNSKGAN